MRILSVQILRAIAALSVAFGHAQSFIGLPMEKQGRAFDWSFFLPWNAGVDLFFVISGFIMVYSSEKLFAAPGGAKAFISRRLARIVPLYWGAMALLLAKMAAFHKPLPDAWNVGASFLFIPWEAERGAAPRPFYELGWTLNYEMFFYVVFALFIGFRRETTVALAAVALAALVAFGIAFPSNDARLFFWTQPIVLEFAFGMGIALLMRNGLVLGSRLRYGLIALGALVFFRDFLDSALQPHLWATPNDFLRVAGWGVPAAMILAACVLKEEQGLERVPIAWNHAIEKDSHQINELEHVLVGKPLHTFPGHALNDNWFERAGARLGDASYALYLSHPIVMSAVAAAWFSDRLSSSPFADKLPASLAVVAAVLCSVVASIAVHRWFEAPVTRFLHAVRRGEGAPSRRSLHPSSSG